MTEGARKHLLRTQQPSSPAAQQPAARSPCPAPRSPARRGRGPKGPAGPAILQQISRRRLLRSCAVHLKVFACADGFHGLTQCGAHGPEARLVHGTFATNARARDSTQHPSAVAARCPVAGSRRQRKGCMHLEPTRRTLYQPDQALQSSVLTLLPLAHLHTCNTCTLACLLAHQPAQPPPHTFIHRP